MGTAGGAGSSGTGTAAISGMVAAMGSCSANSAAAGPATGTAPTNSASVNPAARWKRRRNSPNRSELRLSPV